MGLLSFLKKKETTPSDTSKVRMQVSIGNYEAGVVYDIHNSLADDYIIKNYALGTLTREYTEQEKEAKLANNQVLGF